MKLFIKNWKLHFALFTPFCLLMVLYSAYAQSAPVVYQGHLSVAGVPANGSYDMQFKLFDTAIVNTGGQQGSTVAAPVPVANGIFTVTLDFGAAAFTGAERYLEIGVKPAGTTSAYSTLAPRQQITSIPYAIHSLSAAQLDGRPASSFIQADSNGNVGIGTPVEAEGVRLQVKGNTRVTPSGGIGYLQIGTPNGETGLSVLGKNRFDLRFNDKTVTLAANPGLGPPNSHNGISMNTNGNVGIGMDSPLADSQWKLQINGPFRLTPSYGESAVEFGSPNGETGMSIRNGARADVRFNGSTLKLVAGPAGVVPPPENGVAITTRGDVGIGTTAPEAKLHVKGPEDFSNAIYAEVAGVGSSAIYGSAIGPSSTAVLARNLSGPAIYADGNAVQNLHKGGFVKAMAYIAGDGTILRCYNSQQSGDRTSTVPCNINCAIEDGGYVVHFGFTVKDRFVMVTPDTVGINPLYFKSAGIQYRTDDSVVVVIWATGDNKPALDEFTIIVF
jgi:hypothetical protein